MTPSLPYLVDAAGRQFRLTGPSPDCRPLSLGRAPDCDVVIAERRVSRHHAEVRWDGYTVTLHDLGSTNGTYLNGHRIAAGAGECSILHSGDGIRISSATFTFRDPDATLQESTLPLLQIDPESGEIWVNHSAISLSAKEHCLFSLLHNSSPHPCSKQAIAAAVWPEYETPAAGYQVESLVKRLREKLEPDPRNPVLIITVPSLGYRLIDSQHTP